jgi:hypothetical protein
MDANEGRFDPQITQTTQISFSGRIAPVTNKSRSAGTNAANSLIAIDRTEKSA